MNLPFVQSLARRCALLGFLIAGWANPPVGAEEPTEAGSSARRRTASPAMPAASGMPRPAVESMAPPESIYGDSNAPSVVQPWRLPIFYPPVPPVLGAPIPLPNPTERPSLQPTPPELAEYVNECFYAPLSTRLTQNQINRRLREKINAYRTEKMTLQNELRERLAALQSVDSATRTQELAVLARAQAARIAQLEATAEQIRQELIRGEFFQGSVDWNVIRDWRLGKSRFLSAGAAMTAQYQVMLAAAFYQIGLLPEQRGLLREIAMELNGVRRKGADGADGFGPPLFFSPPTARLRLPAGLPAELRDKIAAYEKEKSELKQELRETIYAQDKAFFSKTRDQAVAALAERQWPRLAALEELAEEIRRGIAHAPNPPSPPEPPPVSAALAARITAFLTQKNKLQADILKKIEQVKRDFSIMRVMNAPAPGSGGELRLVISPSSQNEEQLKVLRATLTAFNQEISSRQNVLRKEAESIRREFEAMAAPQDNRSPESLLDDYAEALQQREEWLLYTDYQTAMLTPGLAPEQRRLLFDGALEQLSLPLPGWEIKTIPTYE